MAAWRHTLSSLPRDSALANRALPCFIAVTDERRQGPFAPLVARLPAGSWVVFRDYHLDQPARLEVASRVRDACRGRGLPFLVARDPDLADTLDADGLHCPEQLLDELIRWRERRPAWRFTAACHGADGLARAEQLGADAAFLSPVFPTRSHPGAETLGAARLAELVRAHPRLAVFAMGGVNSGTIAQLVGTGAVGVAAIDLVSEMTAEPSEGC